MLGGIKGGVFIRILLLAAGLRAHCWGLGAGFRRAASNRHDLETGRDSRYTYRLSSALTLYSVWRQRPASVGPEK